MNYGALLKIVIGLQVLQLCAGVVIVQRLTRLETIYELRTIGKTTVNTPACFAQRGTSFRL